MGDYDPDDLVYLVRRRGEDGGAPFRSEYEAICAVVSYLSVAPWSEAEPIEIAGVDRGGIVIVRMIAKPPARRY